MTTSADRPVTSYLTFSSLLLEQKMEQTRHHHTITDHGSSSHIDNVVVLCRISQGIPYQLRFRQLRSVIKSNSQHLRYISRIVF